VLGASLFIIYYSSNLIEHFKDVIILADTALKAAKDEATRGAVAHERNGGVDAGVRGAVEVVAD
jgi:hypothetical protein